MSSSWIPHLPHAFWGTASVNGRPVRVGETVDARCEGVRWGVEGNPIYVGQEGQYGYQPGFLPKLVVQGDIVNGTPVQFYVAGVRAMPQVPFTAGEVDRIDLVATGDPEPEPEAAGWYLVDWFEQIVMAEPPDAAPLDAEFVRKMMQKAYTLRGYPLQYQHVENDDTYPLAEALGLGMPVTTRWMQVPYAVQGFTGGIIVKPIGVVL